MPVDRGAHVTRRYAPYGHSSGVRHRGPRALQRYGTRVGAAGRKRRAAKNRVVNVPRNKLAFPSGMRTKLRFCIRATYSTTDADNIAKTSFLANSITDPYVGGTNHQPRGFDQFMDVYRTYTVLGSKISVNFMFQGYDGPASLDGGGAYLIKNTENVTTAAEAAALTPVMVGIHKGVTELGTTESASQVMEQDRTVWKAMTPADGSVLVSTSMQTSDFFGKDALVGAEGYTGSNIADVDNKVYYTVWVARASGLTSGVVRSVGYVTIEYDVMFTEPKTLDQS